jgi:hypothetical protein
MRGRVLFQALLIQVLQDSAPAERELANWTDGGEIRNDPFLSLKANAIAIDF